MTQCEECGARNAENATFCVRCGAELAHGAEPSVGEDTDTLAPVGGASIADEMPGATLVLPVADAVAPADLREDGAFDENASADARDAAELAEGAVSFDVADDVSGEAAALLNEASELLAAGDADNAAVKCREAIDIAPDLVAAYSLLGMVEEQRGNTVAAAGAYRRVLQLDPARNVEREKLEALYVEGGAARPGDDADGKRMLAWAPWMAAVAVAFFVLMTLTAVGLRVHHANAAEELYTEQMVLAEAALDSENYMEAEDAFEAALTARPEDDKAQRGLRYARRKLGSSRPAGLQSPDALAQQETYRATIVSSRGPNPFPSIPIGPRSADDDGPELLPGQAPQTVQPTRTPPPVMSSDRVEVTRPSQATTKPDDGAMPFAPEVLDAPPEKPAKDTRDSVDEAPEIAPVEEKSQGEISIWRSPRGSAEPVAAESAPRPVSSSQHADQAQALRQQAQSAINQGNHTRGQQLLDQAIGQYRADSAANPGNRAANRAAIGSLQTLQQQCEVGDGQ